MLRKLFTIVLASILYTSALSAAEVIQVQPPHPKLTDTEVAASFSPEGVRNLTISSSISTNAQGKQITTKVWKWQDKNGVQYNLVRRLDMSTNAIGNLGTYTLEKTRPMNPIVPVNPVIGGGIKVNPVSLFGSHYELALSVSPNGVFNLKVSNPPQLNMPIPGAPSITVYTWQDRNNVTYKLTKELGNYPGATPKYTLEKVNPQPIVPQPVPVNPQPAISNGAIRVMPPMAGTADQDIPAHYSPRGVFNVRATSSATRDVDGNPMTAMVWRWTDRDGVNFKLTRTLVQKPGVIGNLGDYTLEKTASNVSPVPLNPMPVNPMPVNPMPGSMQLPPATLTDTKIPEFYSPNGVKNLLMSSSKGSDAFGREVIETTWKWQDNIGTNYTLTRKSTKANGQLNGLVQYQLSKN